MTETIVPRKVKERPFVFSERSVQAIIHGRQTQVRVPINQDIPSMDQVVWNKHVEQFQVGRMRDSENAWMEMFCPYEVGDLLWVKEKWRNWMPCGCEVDKQLIEYTASPWDPESYPTTVPVPRWKAPVHMPQWASRLTLEIVRVSAERAQWITNPGARAEGIELTDELTGCAEDLNGSYRIAASIIWDKQYGKVRKGKFAWEKNPWVWVLKFKEVAD